MKEYIRKGCFLALTCAVSVTAMSVVTGAEAFGFGNIVNDPINKVVLSDQLAQLQKTYTNAVKQLQVVQDTYQAVQKQVKIAQDTYFRIGSGIGFIKSAADDPAGTMIQGTQCIFDFTLPVFATGSMSVCSALNKVKQEFYIEGGSVPTTAQMNALIQKRQVYRERALGTSVSIAEQALSDLTAGKSSERIKGIEADLETLSQSNTGVDMSTALAMNNRLLLDIALEIRGVRSILAASLKDQAATELTDAPFQMTE